MGDANQQSYCHNCGTQVRGNALYCGDCETQESGESIDEAPPKTWEDIKHTEAGQKADNVHMVFQIVFMLLASGTLLSLIAEYIFGVSSAPTTLLIVAGFAIVAVIQLLKKTWPAFELRTDT